VTIRASLDAVAKRAPAWLRKAAIVVAVAIPILITLDRFRRPYGEKFMLPFMRGSTDLWLPFNGARALLTGVDPYATAKLPPALRDPAGWPLSYPPTMLVLYIPLVLATHANIETACQVFYCLNIAALALFAVVVWLLSRSLGDARPNDVMGALLVIVIALSLNSATMFAIDRGQSELINAALCWTAVLLFTRLRIGAAMAIVTVAAAIKGYAAILALGLLLAAPTLRAFLRGAAAAVSVTLAVTLPAAHRLPAALAAMRGRNDFNFVPIWFNNSFKGLFFHISPAKSDMARYFMLALTAVACALGWWRLATAMRRGDRRAITCRAILFATTALALLVGMQAYSGPYNYLLVLPGLLLFATSFDHFAGILRLRPSVLVPVGATAVVALALALLTRWIGSDVPLAGIALVYMVVTFGGLAVVPNAAAPPEQSPALPAVSRAAAGPTPS
jgi:hypothetical protein